MAFDADAIVEDLLASKLLDRLQSLELSMTQVSKPLADKLHARFPGAVTDPVDFA
jgi:hypothetical protein